MRLPSYWNQPEIGAMCGKSRSERKRSSSSSGLTPGSTRREARLDERQDELRRLVAQGERLEHVEVRDLARLGAEPALGQEPLAQRVLGERVEEVTHRRSPPRAGTSRSRAARA